MTTEPASPTMTVRALPPWPRVAVVTVLAAVASIAVNAGLVWLATAFDPSLQHYSHFRLSDYGTLTAVGVVGAGTAWYVVTRTLDPPRRAFFRTAVVVMLVLWVPDGWLLLKHEPTRGVVFLMIMHLAVALITYNLLVFAAPVTDRGAVYATVPVRSNRAVTSDGDASIPVARVVWLSLMIGVCVEFAAGLFGMLYVPFNRPDGWLSHRGEAIYVLHALLGGLLGVGALAVVLYVFTRAPGRRVDRIAAVSGLVGVVVGALGGILCVDHPLRLLGMALMFLGGSVAFFGYLIPMIDEAPTVAGDAS